MRCKIRMPFLTTGTPLSTSDQPNDGEFRVSGFSGGFNQTGISLADAERCLLVCSVTDRSISRRRLSFRRWSVPLALLRLALISDKIR
jgi:hypothetical protein